VDLKAECGQLYLAHVVRNKIKKLKQTNASAHLVQYTFKIHEGSAVVTVLSLAVCLQPYRVDRNT